MAKLCTSVPSCFSQDSAKRERDICAMTTTSMVDKGNRQCLHHAGVLVETGACLELGLLMAKLLLDIYSKIPSSDNAVQ